MDLPALVDARTGIIRGFQRDAIPPSIPSEFHMLTAVLSDSACFSPWASDSAGAGYSLVDEDAALGPAVGEAIERYCGNLVPAGMRRASRRQLMSGGANVVDPRQHVLFAPEQYSSARFPFSPFDDDLPLEWTQGEDLLSEEPVFVPAQMVWVSYAHRAPSRGVPFLNPVLCAGLAAGVDGESAIWSAMTQMIERDALTMAWHGRRPIREVTPPPWLARLGRGATGSMHTRFLEFPNEFGVVVIAAVVHDSATGYLSMGAACRTRTGPAMRKALAEAFQLQMFSAALDDPDGPFMRAAVSPNSPLKPWRVDRRYLDSCRDDLGDVVEYCTHLQLYLDPRMQDRFEAELATAVVSQTTPAELDALAVLPENGSVNELAVILAERGHRVVWVDLTTADVRGSGMRVVHAFGAGLYSNSSVGLPFLGGRRLADELSARQESRRDLPLPH